MGILGGLGRGLQTNSKRMREDEVASAAELRAMRLAKYDATLKEEAAAAKGERDATTATDLFDRSVTTASNLAGAESEHIGERGDETRQTVEHTANVALDSLNDERRIESEAREQDDKLEAIELQGIFARTGRTMTNAQVESMTRFKFNSGPQTIIDPYGGAEIVRDVTTIEDRSTMATYVPAGTSYLPQGNYYSEADEEGIRHIVGPDGVNFKVFGVEDEDGNLIVSAEQDEKDSIGRLMANVDNQQTAIDFRDRFGFLPAEYFANAQKVNRELIGWATSSEGMTDPTDQARIDEILGRTHRGTSRPSGAAPAAAAPDAAAPELRTPNLASDLLPGQEEDPAAVPTPAAPTPATAPVAPPTGGQPEDLLSSPPVGEGPLTASLTPVAAATPAPEPEPEKPSTASLLSRNADAKSDPRFRLGREVIGGAVGSLMSSYLRSEYGDQASRVQEALAAGERPNDRDIGKLASANLSSLLELGFDEETANLLRARSHGRAGAGAF